MFVTYPNGDRCAFVTTAYARRLVSEAFTIEEDELSEVAWFAPEDLSRLETQPYVARTVAGGHSYGGSVLAAAVSRLRPATAVYVDAGMFIEGGQDRQALIEQFENDRRLRSQREWLRQARPYYDERAIDAEARAAEHFDPATMAAVSLGDDFRWEPEPGSIVVRAAPSDWVTKDSAAYLSLRGVHVRDVPGAAHTVWYSHLQEFIEALPEVFAV